VTRLIGEAAIARPAPLMPRSIYPSVRASASELGCHPPLALDLDPHRAAQAENRPETWPDEPETLIRPGAPYRPAASRYSRYRPDVVD